MNKLFRVFIILIINIIILSLLHNTAYRMGAGVSVNTDGKGVHTKSEVQALVDAKFDGEIYEEVAEIDGTGTLITTSQHTSST